MPTPSLVRGSQSQDITSTQRKRSVVAEVFEIQEQEAELVQLTMARYSKKKPNIIPVDSRKYEYNERRLPPKTVAITVIAGTTLTFSDADCEFLRKGSIISQGRGLTARVDATPNYAANTVAIDADPGFVVGDVVLAGIAGSENDSLPPSYHTDPALDYNYLQEVNDAYQFSRWAGTEARYDGPIRDANLRAMRLYHKIGINRVCWFGRRASATDAAGLAVLESRGIINTITTNVTAFDGGILRFRALRDMVGDYTTKSPSAELDCYISPDVWTLLDSMFFEKQRITESIATVAGVQMRKIALGPKTLNLIQAVGFVGPYSTYMVVIDPSYFEICTGKNQSSGERQWMLEIMQGSPELNIQAEKITYVSDVGPRLVAEEAHFIATGAAGVG